MKKSENIRKAVLVICFVMITSVGHAQLPGFDDSQNDTTPAPITSIIIIGLIAGAIYGVKKLE